MKKPFSLIVCTTAILALYSCNSFEDVKPSNETEGTRTIELSDSVKQIIVEKGTFMIGISNKVDSLKTELNSIKAENAAMKKKVAELNSPNNIWIYLSIASFVIGVIAFIVAFFKGKGLKEEEVSYIVKRYLDDSERIKKLQVNVKDLLSQRNVRTPSTGSSYAPKSDSRIQQLENQLAQVIEAVNKITSPAQQSVSYRQEKTCSHEENEYQKVGYAKVDTDLYFTTIYDSNQEGCVFKITFTSQFMGKFNIIALDKIQSRNDWQKKVECSGGVSIKDASDYLLEEEGVCEKIDEYSWKVTKPLKIRLLK